MVTQSTAPEISSTARELLDRALRAPSRPHGVQMLLEQVGGVAGKELLEDALYKQRKSILLELANLHEDGLTRFRRKWGRRFSRVRVGEIFGLREDLRRIWATDTSVAEKQSILNRWSAWHPAGFASLGFQAWFPSLPLGRLLPHHDNLHAQLVQAVLEHFGHLIRCGNPSCVAPYLVARRRDQRYCEQGDCTQYAQRRFSLDWWNRQGRKRRAEKQYERRAMTRTKKPVRKKSGR